jgi:hypothetical protein
MRLRFAVSLVAFSVAVCAQTTELDRFVGRDLWKDQSDHRGLADLIGEVPKGEIWEPTPWHVWKFNRNGVTRYVVLLVESEAIVPGGSTACVQLFDGSAKKLGSWSFRTGHRMTPTKAAMKFFPDIGSDLVVIDMEQYVNGRDVGREYYALNGDRLRLVRIEDHKGKASKNEYVYDNAEIGVAPDETTVEQWAGMLASEDRAVALSALTFLGGRHLTEPGRNFLPEPKESKYASLFQELLGDSRIHNLINRFTKSENEWIRQAALLAVRGPRERLVR